MRPNYTVLLSLGFLVLTLLAADGKSALAHDEADSGGVADPLPPGAIARIGTLRLRHTADVGALAISPDGRVIVSAARYPEEPICIWDSRTGRKLHEISSRDQQLAISPDSRSLATAGRMRDNAIRFWNLNTGALDREIQVESAQSADGHQIGRIAFGPDGSWLAVECRVVDRRGMPMHPWTTTVRFIDSATGKQSRYIETPQPKGHQSTSFALAANGRWLALADGKRQTVHLFGLNTRQSAGTLGNHITSCAFSADGARLALAEYREVRLIDVAKRELYRRFLVDDGRQGNRTGVVALSADGKTLAAAGDFHVPMNVWDVETGRPLFSVAWSGNERPGPIVFSPDGKQVIIAVGPTIRVYNVDSGREALFENAWRRRLQAAIFSPDGKSIAVCGYGDRGVRLYDVATMELRHELASDEKVRAVAFSIDSATLATGGQTITHWNTSDGNKSRLVQGNLAPPRVTGPTITSLAFSTDGRQLFAGTQLGDLQVFKLDDARLLRSIPQPIEHDEYRESVRGLIRFPDGKRAATRTGNVLLWDLQSGSLLATWEAGGCDGEPGRPLTLSPDGRTLAYERRVEMENGSRLEAVLHDTSNLKPPRRLNLGDNSREQFSEVSFAFATSGQVLATGAADNSVRLWSVETRDVLQRFDGHIDRVSYVDCSPDGKLLASTSWDGTVLIWDVGAWSEKP